MKIALALLTGSILVNLTISVVAQPGKYSGEAIPRLFSAFIRSSVETDSASVNHTVSRKICADDRKGTEKEKEKIILNEEALKICCEKVENDKRRIYYLSTRNGKMVMRLEGIYTREALIFFHLSLSNRSHLDYDMDSVRFLIADKSGYKSAASRITELQPVYVYGNLKIVKGKSREPGVIALRRFTLPPGKRLLIEAREKNGGRHLQIQADNNTLVRARLI